MFKLISDWISGREDVAIFALKKEKNGCMSVLLPTKSA